MTTKTFRAIAEDRPGDAWRERFQASWPGVREWYLKDGDAARPSLAACARAFDRHMPELKPMWRHLCGLVGDDRVARRMLSMWSPPNVFDGCSVAVTTDGEPVLMRNYDFDLSFTGSNILKSDWSGRVVIGLDQGAWGLLDGMNADGLVCCLTFGGRPVCGKGFSVILVVRYILETCRTAAEAKAVLLRLRTHLQQNIVVLDRSGDHFTALMAPDRPTRIWQTPVTTNHPENVEWPEHAAGSRSVERFEHLRDRLGRTDLGDAFFEPPVYKSLSGDFATVYTALYRPARGEAIYRWPGHEMRQSFAGFTPGEVEVEYTADAPARVTTARAA